MIGQHARTVRPYPSRDHHMITNVGRRSSTCLPVRRHARTPRETPTEPMRSPAPARLQAVHHGLWPRAGTAAPGTYLDYDHCGVAGIEAARAAPGFIGGNESV